MTTMQIVIAAYAFGAGFWTCFGLSTFSSHGEFDNSLDAVKDALIYVLSVALWPFSSIYAIATGDVPRRKEYRPDFNDGTIHD